MRLERLCEKNRRFFDAAFALYESAFPVEERRDGAEQLRVMDKEDYHFDLIMQDGELLGVMLYWETDDFVYLEHFTTLPSVRGRGLGARALELLKAKGKTVILEIEDPLDEMTRRRFGFYERNGFLMTPHHHIQAKYHLGDEDLMLKILSYPHIISTEEYLSFQDYMTKEIGILPRFNDGITVRKMNGDDDKLQVAKLIYMSDKYIYPNWFDSIEDGQRVLAEMMSLPTVYNQSNITVAVTEDGFVAGAIVSCDSPAVTEEKYLYEAFARAGVECDEKRTHGIYLDYYAKMNDPEGYYLANVAVDPDYRKRGIAATMLLHVINGKEMCHLECVKDNIGAWRVYQRVGFTIVEEYPGVFDIPCYKMIRR
ncbi:MAG: GNAT family N-acetyltransferase [Clostridia bacterium]|nr:GNAT family N-acetyltransferase [Clostridia bacterium]